MVRSQIVFLKLREIVEKGLGHLFITVSQVVLNLIKLNLIIPLIKLISISIDRLSLQANQAAYHSRFSQ